MPLNYKQIIKILENYNFKLSRQKGSHQRFEKNGYGITVAKHRDFKAKTAQSMLKNIASIEGVDLKEIIKKYNIKL